MDEVALADPRKCKAHSSRTGLPCKRWAIKGATVCRHHGGAAPQVQAKAEQRLRAMVDPMLDKLHTLAMQTDNLKVASDCVRDALDRAGIGAPVQAKVRSSQREQQQGSGITVNIGYLAVAPIEPNTQTLAIDVTPAQNMIASSHPALPARDSSG